MEELNEHNVLGELSKMTTDSGDEVILQPVSHVILAEIGPNLQKRFKEEGKPIDPPTYESVLADGRIEINEYDEESLEYPLEWALEEADNDADKAREIVTKKTAEAVALWDAHQAAKLELELEQKSRHRDFLLKNGVKSWNGGRDVPPEWVEELLELDFPIPESQKGKELFYIMRGLLKTPNDQIEASRKIMFLTANGVDQSLIAGAMEFFRLQMDGQNPPSIPSNTEGTKVLDDEPEGRGS